MRVLHHMNRHNCLSTNSSTYHPLWVSFKCCAALILLSSFSSRVRLVSSEYLTTSGRENPLSSCPMNPEISGNRISVPMDWADRVALTNNSNSVYRKRFTWLFHDFGFWMEWVGRELPRRRLWHRSSKQLSWESGHVKGIWPLAQRSRYRHHFNRCLYRCLIISFWKSIPWFLPDHLTITWQWISATTIVLGFLGVNRGRSYLDLLCKWFNQQTTKSRSYAPNNSASVSVTIPLI